MSQERLLILRMIAEGKLSAEEGNRLIEALDGGGHSNGKAASGPAYQAFSRTARDVRKGLEDIGQKAGEILRERQNDLRSQVEEIKRNVGKAAKANSTNADRDHTITIEVEDEPASGDGAPSRRREGAPHDDQ
jgi:polyhydroxyalkanoate synthesis regulator phasin